MATTRPSSPAGPGVMAILLLAGLCTWFALTQSPAPIRQDWSSAPSFWQPRERNAFLRLPTIGLVKAITFAPDQRHGWAISALNSLVTTSDGGHTWAVRSSDLAMASMLAFSDDGRQGWAAGHMGVLHSDDGGTVWTTVANPLLDSKRWTALAFDPGGQAGVLAAADGTLVSTDDGGLHWRLGKPYVSTGQASAGKLLAAAWSGRDHGWVVGEGARVTRTVNAGGFWSDSATGIPAGTTLTRVHFLRDGLRGWVIGSGGELFASKDSGKSWDPLPVVPGARFVDVRFAGDARRGWALAQDNAVFATTDGGAHWARRSQLAGRAPDGFDVAADGTRIRVSGYWGVRTSDDGGTSWRAETRNALSAISAIAFGADGAQGWAVGDSGTVLRSGEAGASWTAQPVGVQGGLQGLAVSGDGLHAWVVGDAGTLLQTADGGGHWTVTRLGGGENLRRVAFSSDGVRGLVIGQQGAIWLSGDGGRTWRTPRAGISLTALDDLSTRNDGKDAWVSSVDGKLFHSSDGGDAWQAAAWADFPGGAAFHAAGATELPKFDRAGQRAWLNRNEREGCGVKRVDIHPGDPCGTLLAAFQGDAATGWAVTPGSVIHITHDGGQNWQSACAPYQRLPGPWYWAASLLLAAGLLLALRASGTRAGASAGVNMFADDDAISAFEDDRLEFGPLARGLSRFLRNPKTSPPLTLSITGDWGAGKSSLMGLLCADLRRHGQRPIWFNAWHHQQDEQLFSALLGTIQAQAAPSSWRPAGWIFRVKLLWRRSTRHFLLTFMLLVLVAMVLTLQLQQGADWGGMLALVQGLPDLLKDPGAMTAQQVRGHVSAAAPFLALLPAARFLYKNMKTFGVDPALMFSSAAENVSLKEASARNNFRATFARQFEEVAAALPYRMTIVIDDLDRCRPEHVLEVLETVNFLTSSGRCFVVFGMASERVEAALRLAFVEIAAEMDALHDDDAGASMSDDPAARARHRRRVYARDYLEKLINLEIAVPQRGEIGADALFAARTAQRAAPFRTASLAFAAYWPLWLAALAVCTGILIGNNVHWPAPQALAVAAAPAAPQPAMSAGAVADMASRTQLVADMKRLPPVFTEGASSSPWTIFGPPAVVVVLLLALAVAHALLRVHAQALEVQDTEAFRTGLKIWTEVAAARRTTPRAIKRWGNRLRYFAMLQQGNVVEATRGERMAALASVCLGAWRRRLQGAGRAANFLARMLPTPPAPLLVVPPPLRHTVIEEGRLIAIGAAHELCQAGWRAALDGAGASARLRGDVIGAAIARHAEVTGQPWRPITDDEARAFERLLAGIKLPAPGVGHRPGSMAPVRDRVSAGT